MLSQAEVRLYDRLFTVPNPDSESNFLDVLNPDSLQILDNCLVEASLEKSGARKPFPVRTERLFLPG